MAARARSRGPFDYWPGFVDVLSTLLLVIAAVTMVVGALGAVAQDDLNRLLSFLLHRPGQVVPAGELLDHLHGVGTEREANALEALLTRLRRKLGPGVIETKRGQGYCVPAPDEP